MRLAEGLAAMSLASDVGNGLPLEKSLRDAVLAARLADRAGLAASDCADAFYVALLRAIGCVGNAHENAALFGDDRAFVALWDRMDVGHPAEFARDVLMRVGAGAPPFGRARTVTRFLRAGPAEAARAGLAACEVAAALACRVGLPESVATGLAQAYERFDGRGNPAGLRGDELTLPARVVHVVQVAELAFRDGGRAAAVAAVRHRSGGHLDPALAEVLAAAAGELLEGLDGDALIAALDAEPLPHAELVRGDLDRVASALADFADLKSPWTLGHSSRTAELVVAAGADGALRRAALLHDVGRVGVSNGIWDKPGRLSAADRERVRLHPHWTQRILARTPAFAALAPLAAADHERLDGTGYHRGLEAPGLDRNARLLAAADAYVAMTSARPHRRPLPPDAAARGLRGEGAAGRLCPSAVEAVLDAAGHTPRHAVEGPNGLTEREIQVLRLAARGLSNKAIAAELVISPRTVQNHLARIYDKTGRRTRAGAALFAMEHGLTHTE